MAATARYPQKPKERALKKLVVLIFVVLFALSINGCTSYIKAQSISEIPAETEHPDQSAPQPTEAWQDVYAVFLREYPFLDEDKFSSVGREDIFSQFALRDLDNDAIPELLMFQLQKSGFNQVFTAYAYDGTVYKLGDYSNPKGSFVSWFRIPGSSMYPGLYECWHGGGQEYCQYLSVKDRVLTCEYLWHMDRSGESPILTELSDNKQLVNDSIDAFPPYDYSENLLEAYFINDETINQVILDFSDKP